jgi:hypothetical protein
MILFKRQINILSFKEFLNFFINKMLYLLLHKRKIMKVQYVNTIIQIKKKLTLKYNSFYFKIIYKIFY